MVCSRAIDQLLLRQADNRVVFDCPGSFHSSSSCKCPTGSTCTSLVFDSCGFISPVYLTRNGYFCIQHIFQRGVEEFLFFGNFECQELAELLFCHVCKSCQSVLCSLIWAGIHEVDLFNILLESLLPFGKFFNCLIVFAE